MRLSYLFWTAALTFALVPLAAIARGQPDPNKAKPAAVRAALPDPKAPPAVQLPLTRVVLYNAGIAYFHREGDVTDNARLDLKFDEGDINDLLKSLVLTDKDGGKVRAVTYDNRVPVEFTLKGFAIDVTENPTMGQLLHQLRGEKVEVTDRAGVSTVGRIVSVERPPVHPKDTNTSELLNVLTDDGLQTVELKALKKTKLMRPELQAEFVKALETLAGAKGDNKKAVSVVFSGNGKRKVAVGYVTEAPLWKPSYRLTVDEKGATRMQGWANIENTTDEDWVNVKVGLVAGRPMTFQMDMYDPLYVPRPTVEPDLFASLRPPMYQGGLNPLNPGGVAMGGMLGMQAGGALGFGGQNAGFGGLNQNQGAGGGNAGFGGLNQNQGAGGGFTSFGGAQGNLGFQGGGQWGQLGGQFGFQGGLYGNVPAYLPRVPRPALRDLYGERLGFSEYVARTRGNGSGPPNEERARPVRDPLDREGGALAAADGSLGDMFEYSIDEPISLARQKSAMLPLLNEQVEGGRVSIYNASTLAKHPLLGLKLTNKTKLHLAQGPVAVYDGGTFAGDERLPDLKPGETRLVSYAIDLGTEVVESNGPSQFTLLGVSCDANTVVSRGTFRRTTTYTLRNRNTTDRTVIVEHPLNANQKLIAPEKPSDRTRDHYRFDVPVKAGEAVAFNVVEETTTSTSNALADRLNRYLGGALEVRTTLQPITTVGASITDGRVQVRAAQRRTTAYAIKNTATAERTIPVEHHKTKGWALVSPAKPDAVTATASRFDLKIKPDATATLEVVEESATTAEHLLSGLVREELTRYAALAGTSGEARAIFTRALTMRDQLDAVRKALAQEQTALKEIADDQDRIRKNIEKTPKESEAYKRYLKKFDDQETVIEKHQAKIKELTTEAAKQESALRAFADTAKAP